MIKSLLITILLVLQTGAAPVNKAETSGKTLKVLKLTTENTVSLSHVFSSRSVARVVLDVYRLNNRLPKNQPIYLVLDSPGGSVVAGLQMFSLLKALDRPIHTVTVFAASMGFHTVQNLGRRYILPHGVLMSHLATGGTRGTIPGSANTRLDFWTEMISDMDSVVVDRTNKKFNLPGYKAMVKTEYWGYGQRAVEAGFADEVVIATCEYNLVRKKTCPIISNKVSGYLPMQLIAPKTGEGK